MFPTGVMLPEAAPRHPGRARLVRADSKLWRRIRSARESKVSAFLSDFRDLQVGDTSFMSSTV